MDFIRKARRADDDEESETRCFFSQILGISIISSSSTTSVFDRRFTTKTCEGANMANHLCYPGARYRYMLVSRFLRFTRRVAKGLKLAPRVFFAQPFGFFLKIVVVLDG